MPVEEHRAALDAARREAEEAKEVATQHLAERHAAEQEAARLRGALDLMVERVARVEEQEHINVAFDDWGDYIRWVQDRLGIALREARAALRP